MVAGVLAGLVFVPRLLARPGTLLTRDGHTVLGDITETQDSVIVVLHGIASRYDRADVAQVIYNGTVEEQFHARLRKLDPLDLRGRMDLAGWASQQQRPDLAVEALQQARNVDPTNRDVALALQAAQRQQDLDALRHHPSTAPSDRVDTPRVAPVSPLAESTTAPALPPPRYRLLTDDEVNRLRQKELGPGDAGTVFEFRNDLARRYLAETKENAKRFRALPIGAQAREILADGNPQDADDVRVRTDPASLQWFHQHLMPVIATACGSVACHGGGEGGGGRGGSFELFTGDAPNTVYTNFYILQNYSTAVGGTEYRMIDRTLPSRSLLLQFALPADQANPRHPNVPDFRPRFRTPADSVYQHTLDWITNDLAPIEPDYHIRVLAEPPTTTERAGAGG